jgi:hypothetical protein
LKWSAAKTERVTPKSPMPKTLRYGAGPVKYNIAERIQGNPRNSNGHFGGFRSKTGTPQENPN